MTKPIARDAVYGRRLFDAEVVELCVRWYITYRLSCRDHVVVEAPPSQIVPQQVVYES